MTNLEIDWTRCKGHGLCATILPHLITLDDWGYPIIAASAHSKGAHSDRDDLIGERRAAAVCPALALRLTARA